MVARPRRADPRDDRGARVERGDRRLRVDLRRPRSRREPAAARSARLPAAGRPAPALDGDDDRARAAPGRFPAALRAARRLRHARDRVHRLHVLVDPGTGADRRARARPRAVREPARASQPARAALGGHRPGYLRAVGQLPADLQHGRHHHLRDAAERTLGRRVLRKAGSDARPDCVSATPPSAMAAPVIFVAVNGSPIVAHATSPATGGIPYIIGAVRATPRTALTQPQTSQPTKADSTTVNSSAIQIHGSSAIQSMRNPTGAVSTTIGSAPSSVAQAITTSPPWRRISGFDATV